MEYAARTGPVKMPLHKLAYGCNMLLKLHEQLFPRAFVIHFIVADAPGQMDDCV